MVSELTKVSENKDAEIASLKVQISENENSHKLALNDLNERMKKLLSKNGELKRKSYLFNHTQKLVTLSRRFNHI